MGTVSDIAGDKISVQTVQGQVITVIKGGNTEIDTGDVGPSGQMAVGGAVLVYFDPATHIASKIELEKPGALVTPPATTQIEGTVVSFSSIYIVLKAQNGDLAPVEMVVMTVLQYEDGTPAKRADVKPGVMIEATVHITSHWATRIEIKR